MSDIHDPFAELTVGAVLTNGASVVALRKLRGYDPVGGMYAAWRAVCVRPGTNFHDYVIWTVNARPEGFVAANGSYHHDLWDALEDLGVVNHVR